MEIGAVEAVVCRIVLDLSRVSRRTEIDSGRAEAKVHGLVPSVLSCPDQKNSSPIIIKDDFREGLPAARELLSLLSSLSMDAQSTDCDLVRPGLG